MNHKQLSVFIDRWQAKLLISEQQAIALQADVDEQLKLRSSNGIVQAIAYLGAILLGLGTILFIAANWSLLHFSVKAGVLLVALLGAYFGGWYLKNGKQQLTHIGTALIVLSGILWAANLFWWGQYFHVIAWSPWLIFWWLVGMLPLVFQLQNSFMSFLAAVVWQIWLVMLVFRTGELYVAPEFVFLFVPSLLIFANCALFSIAGLGRLWLHQAEAVFRTWRIWAIHSTMFVLLLLTFGFVLGGVPQTAEAQNFLLDIIDLGLLPLLATGLMAVVLAILNWWLGRQRQVTRTVQLELFGIVGLVFVTMVLFVFPSLLAFSDWIYTLLFIILAVTWWLMGYRLHDEALVTLGFRYTGIFVIVKYIDLTRQLLPGSIVFLSAGALLLIGGTFMERRRKRAILQLKVMQ